MCIHVECHCVYGVCKVFHILDYNPSSSPCRMLFASRGNQVKHKFSALRKQKPFAELSTTHAKLNAKDSLVATGNLINASVLNYCV